MNCHTHADLTKDVLRVLSDDKSLILFNTITLASAKSNVLINRLNLTPKQYYPRIIALIKTGLIKRQNGKYFVTPFGKIVYQAQIIIGKAVKNYWKLQAIDSIEMSVSFKLSTKEHNKIIETLIEHDQIKELLIKEEEEKEKAAAGSNYSNTDFQLQNDSDDDNKEWRTSSE